MKSPFALLLTAALLLSACDTVVDVSADRDTPYAAPVVSDGALRAPVAPSASCPCFNRISLADAPDMLSNGEGPTVDPYLFFDAFNYYGLDARRTEVRSTIVTREGAFEEVAAVYITGDNEGLHLICSLQEVVRHPASGALTYRYETLSPTVEEAEACRQDIDAFVDKREPCQGAACGIPYSDVLLDPDYPPYNDGTFDTPPTVLEAMRLQIQRVSRMIQGPA